MIPHFHVDCGDRIELHHDAELPWRRFTRDGVEEFATASECLADECHNTEGNPPYVREVTALQDGVMPESTVRRLALAGRNG